MAFGGGILFNYFLYNVPNWNNYIVIIGYTLVACGASYGTVLGVYLWWPFRRREKKGKMGRERDH